MLLVAFITVSIGLIGLSAYYSSAHFGCRSSGMDLLPPHYTHVPDTSDDSAEEEE